MTAREEFEEAWVTSRRTLPTGRCAKCGRTFRLRSNGTVWTHRNDVTSHTSPYYRQNCAGSGQQPTPTP